MGDADRETCKPALAMELKLDSCLPDGLRKAMDSAFAIEAVVPVMELDTAIGSGFVCINAAMEVEGFAPT